MRFLRILALSAGGLWLGSCGDEGGGATVNKDISWYVGCASGGCGSGRTYHDQAKTKKRFTVTCQKIGPVIEFTITDPGEDDNPDTPVNETRPGSSITVNNGNSDARTCDVTVRDYPDRAASGALVFSGKCGGSSTTGGCTLSGRQNEGGFDWKGSLTCNPMDLQNSPSAKYTLVSGSQVDQPVLIAIDNCD